MRATPGAESDDYAAPTGRGVGRPRRFDAEVERRLVMDTALRVMARNRYADAPVHEVLTEAGVSTRAFYRHFATKDALLLALFRRDSEAVARSLRAAVDAAPSAVTALDAWIDGYLDLFYEPRRASRVALFTAPAVQACEGYAAELDRTRAQLGAPLVDALRRGAEEGTLHSPDPVQDGRTLEAIAESVLAPTGKRRYATREEAKAYIERFSFPAIGL